MSTTTTNASNTSSVTSLMEQYNNMQTQWASKNLFGKSWSLAHLSVDATFEVAFLSLVWAQVACHVLSGAAIQTADSCEVALYFWGKQNQKWRDEINKIESGSQSQPEQLKLF